MKQIRTVAVDGMTCANCVDHVTRALNSIDGVQVMEVAIGSARVQYDPNQVPEQRIIEAVKEAGYGGRISES